jgi:hypothetical protein
MNGPAALSLVAAFKSKGEKERVMGWFGSSIPDFITGE